MRPLATAATDLADARVLVTASSQGIGYAAAEAFLDEGARVVVNSSNADRLAHAVERLRAHGPVHGVLADLTAHAGIDRLVDEAIGHLGGLDTLVYVTGSPRPGTFLEQGYEEWVRAANLLIVSPAYLAKRVAPTMVTQPTGGRMVFLTSFVIREPVSNLALSSVCRGAVAGLVRLLARELGPKGVRVNGILPGYIRTGRVEEVARDAAARRNVPTETVLGEIEGEIPLRRIGAPAELARAIVFLGSERSSYVSGAMLPVDGAILRSIG